MTPKGYEANEDWIKREQGRIPSKGAMAAERASAGLGTSSDDDAARPTEPAPPQTVWAKRVPKITPPGRE